MDKCKSCHRRPASCTCYNEEVQPVSKKSTIREVLNSIEAPRATLAVGFSGRKREARNLVKNSKSTHYALWEGLEAIDVIKKTLTPEEYRGFLKGNILKYQLRLGKKDDVEKEIMKIKDYRRELDESFASSTEKS